MKSPSGPVKLLLVLGAALLFLAGGAYLLERSGRVGPDEDDWYILLHGPLVNGTKLSLEQLRSLPPVEVGMVLLGTGEDGREHIYKGVLIRELLREVGAGNHTKVTIRAADAYSKSFPRDVIEGFDILLAYEKDGSAIPPRSKGGPGPVRLMAPQGAVGTYNAQHCVKWVSEVVVE